MRPTLITQNAFLVNLDFTLMTMDSVSDVPMAFSVPDLGHSCAYLVAMVMKVIPIIQDVLLVFQAFSRIPLVVCAKHALQASTVTLLAL